MPPVAIEPAPRWTAPRGAASGPLLPAFASGIAICGGLGASTGQRLFLVVAAAVSAVALAALGFTAGLRQLPTGIRSGWRVALSSGVALAVGGVLPPVVAGRVLAVAVLPLAVAVAVLAGAPSGRPERTRWGVDIALALGGWAVLALLCNQQLALPAMAAAVLAATAAASVLLRAGYPCGLSLRTTGLLAAALIGAATAQRFPPAGIAAAMAVALAVHLRKPEPAGPLLPRSNPIRGAVVTAAATTAPVLATLAVVAFDRGALSGGSPTTWAVWTLLAAALVRGAVALADDLLSRATLDARVGERTQALAAQQQLFRALIQNSSDVITVVDRGGTVRYQSPAVATVFGHDPASLVGTAFRRLLPPDDVARVEGVLDAAASRRGSVVRLECQLLHADGGWRSTETVLASLLDDPDIRGLVLTTHDVTERRQLEADLTRVAFTDSLTGLASRSLFRERVERALEPAHHRITEPVVVIFCDLDGFKSVNDTQGHAVGDELLCLVASRIQHSVRPGDTVARMGGDEFAILVTGVGSEEAAAAVTERVATALAQPFLLDGREIYVGTSAGIASTTPGADTADVLLRNADLAMYRAKASGDSSCVRFEPSMHDDRASHVALGADLRQALARGELALHYQPIVNLSNRRIVGAEALLRWMHPTRGVVDPKEFLRLAAETGVMVQLGDWVLREALAAARHWQSAVPPGDAFEISVNVSGQQLQPALVGTVVAALAHSGLPAAALVLEMTEDVLIECTTEAPGVLAKLKALGVRLALDDFGTGYSSLSFLSRLPVDMLKIDRSSVAKLSSPGAAPAGLARTIVALGQSMGIVTVAEGIERTEELAALREMGCLLGQGFLFARPMPADALSELLAMRGSAPRNPAQHPAAGHPEARHPEASHPKPDVPAQGAGSAVPGR